MWHILLSRLVGAFVYCMCIRRNMKAERWNKGGGAVVCWNTEAITKIRSGEWNDTSAH